MNVLDDCEKQVEIENDPVDLRAMWERAELSIGAKVLFSRLFGGKYDSSGQNKIRGDLKTSDKKRIWGKEGAKQASM